MIKILVDDVGDGSIDRARKLLSGIPHGADKAVGSALKRASRTGMAYATKMLQREYVAGSGTMKSYTATKIHYNNSAGGTTVDLEFRGHHIPLMKFDVSVGSDGRVRARVKRSSAKAALDHVFSATVGSHTGLFERETSSRFPVEEKMGPSVPQMLSANDDLQQELGDKIREAFEERIDHEILAVLNGWRA